MAEVEMASSSESEEELALEVLSGFVKTVYKAVKDEGLKSPNKSVTNPVVPGCETEQPKKTNESQPFQDLLFHAAKSLNLDSTVQDSDKPIFPEKDTQDRVLFPLNNDISQQCYRVWSNPATCPQVLFAAHKTYRGLAEGTILTTTHPSADSALVFIASGCRTTNSETVSFPDQQSQSMNATGRKIYESGGMNLKQANAAAVTSRYNQHLWSQLSDLLEALSEDSKNKALEIQKEGLALAKSSIQVAQDQADVSARTMTSGVLLRRRVWLRICKSPPEVVNKVLDLPFDGRHLFSSTTEEVMERMKSEHHKGKSDAIHPLSRHKRPNITKSQA